MPIITKAGPLLASAPPAAYPRMPPGPDRHRDARQLLLVLAAGWGPLACTAVLQYVAVDVVGMAHHPVLRWMLGWDGEAIAAAALALRRTARAYRADSLPRLLGFGLLAALAVALSRHQVDVLTDLVWLGLVLDACLRLRAIRLVRSHLGVAPVWAGTSRYRRQAVVAFTAAVAGMCAASALGSWLAMLAHWLPIGAHRPLPGLALAVHIVVFAVAEETALVAVLVTGLDTVGWSWRMILVIGVAARVSFHLYYGPAAITFVVFAAVNLILYRRTRRLTPLIFAHLDYDMFAGFGGTPAAVVVFGIGTVTIPVAAVLISVRASRALRARRGTLADLAAAPGWEER